MDHSDMRDNDIVRNLTFFERRYTAEGLKKLSSYRSLLSEAVKRGLRQENLTEQEQLVRVDLEGPSLDRQT